MAYDKLPLDESTAIKQLWGKFLRLKSTDEKHDATFTDIYNRLENLARQLYGTGNPNRNITVNNDTDAAYAEEAGNADTLDYLHKEDFAQLICVTRDVANYVDSTTEIGYFSLESGEPFSLDVAINASDGSHSFAGMFHVEGYANDTSTAWQIVPVTWYKQDDLAIGQEYCIEINTSSTECRLRVRRIFSQDYT